MTVGVHAADVLVLQHDVTLQRVLRLEEVADAPVGTYPDGSLVPLGHDVRPEVSGIDELGLHRVVFQSHLVDALSVDDGIDVTIRADHHGVLGLEVLVALDALQRIHNGVGMAVEHKDAPVVHAQPDVLRLVGIKVSDAVVQQGYAAGVARSVVEEVEPVEARQSVP